MDHSNMNRNDCRCPGAPRPQPYRQSPAYNHSRRMQNTRTGQNNNQCVCQNEEHKTTCRDEGRGEAPCRDERRSETTCRDERRSETTCRETNRCEASGLKDCTKRDQLYGLPLSMAYIPWQNFRNLYPWSPALDTGTIFSELDFPFERSKCSGRCRR